MYGVEGSNLCHWYSRLISVYNKITFYNYFDWPFIVKYSVLQNLQRPWILSYCFPFCNGLKQGGYFIPTAF